MPASGVISFISRKAAVVAKHSREARLISTSMQLEAMAIWSQIEIPEAASKGALSDNVSIFVQVLCAHAERSSNSPFKSLIQMVRPPSGIGSVSSTL